MCQWCISTVISEHLTSGISGDRRQFLKYSSALLASSAATYTASSLAQSNQAIEVIFRNGPIYPIAGDNKRVEALAIGGGKIRSLGSVSDVMRTASASTTVVDLQGRTLVLALDLLHTDRSGGLNVELATRVLDLDDHVAVGLDFRHRATEQGRARYLERIGRQRNRPKIL